MDKISYAFGKDYLSDWGLKEALREVFQNYIDYGEYDIQVNSSENTDNVLVCITNKYLPTGLEFMRLGNSSKSDGTKIGHHGEGLKAAFLIFGREDLYFSVRTNKYILTPIFEDSIIGETLSIKVSSHSSLVNQFTTQFYCPKDIYEDFITNDIIKPKDVLYSHPTYGDLIWNKPKGNIYCGNLFVCNIKGLNYSYNIKPNKLQLDRDRKTPRDFDLDYATSNILSSYQRSQATTKPLPVDYNSREYRYSGYVDEADIENIEAVNAKGTIQYLHKTTGTMINNEAVKRTLNNHPKFISLKSKSYRTELLHKIRDAKRFRTSTLLKVFKKNYCGSDDLDMNIDIDVIINRFKEKK